MKFSSWIGEDATSLSLDGRGIKGEGGTVLGRSVVSLMDDAPSLLFSPTRGEKESHPAEPAFPACVYLERFLQLLAVEVGPVDL